MSKVPNPTLVVTSPVPSRVGTPNLAPVEHPSNKTSTSPGVGGPSSPLILFPFLTLSQRSLQGGGPLYSFPLVRLYFFLTLGPHWTDRGGLTEGTSFVFLGTHKLPIRDPGPDPDGRDSGRYFVDRRRPDRSFSRRLWSLSRSYPRSTLGIRHLGLDRSL